MRAAGGLLWDWEAGVRRARVTFVSIALPWQCACSRTENIRLIVAAAVSVEQDAHNAVMYTPEGFHIGLPIHLDAQTANISKASRVATEHCCTAPPNADTTGPTGDAP